MAKRKQHMGERYIEADNGFGWSRKRASVASVQSASYEATVFGVRYELEKRRRSPGDTPDTGWYLYSFGVSGGFFGEWCGSHLMPAIDEASDLIAKADLRGEGYERIPDVEETVRVEPNSPHQKMLDFLAESDRIIKSEGYEKET